MFSKERSTGIQLFIPCFYERASWYLYCLELHDFTPFKPKIFWGRTPRPPLPDTFTISKVPCGLRVCVERGLQWYEKNIPYRKISFLPFSLLLFLKFFIIVFFLRKITLLFPPYVSAHGLHQWKWYMYWRYNCITFLCCVVNNFVWSLSVHHWT